MNKKEYDVIIVGGGTGGVCAAAAFAGTGYKVAVIEENSALGGTTTEGGVSTWIEGVNLDFHREMFNHLKKTGNAEGELESSWLPSKFSDKASNILKMNPLKIEEYYKEYFEGATNIDVYYNSSFESVIKMDSNAITEISVSVKGEICVFSATFFIDSSGDGVLCRSAGEYMRLPKDSVYLIGRDAKSRFCESLAMNTDDPHQLNEPSLFFELTNTGVDNRLYRETTTVYATYLDEKIEDDVFLDDDVFNYNYGKQTLDKIRIVKPDYINADGYVDVLKKDNNKIFFCNPMCGAGVSGDDYLCCAKEKRYECMKNKTLEYWKFIKYSLLLAKRKGETGQWNRSGWSVSNYIFNMTGNFSKMCGVRESFRVKCQCMLNQNDLVKDVRESDIVSERYIAIGSHNVDMHNQIGLSGIEEFNRSSLRPYGIKYDSLVPSFLSNTLIGCKAFGASQIAVSSARIVKTVSQLGWTCGCAIKLCLDNNLRDTTIDDELISILQSNDYTGFIRYYAIIKNQKSKKECEC